jgi:hypothetical protein
MMNITRLVVEALNNNLLSTTFHLNKDCTQLWSTTKEIVVKPWKQVLEEYHDSPSEELENWGSIHVYYPLPLTSLSELPAPTKNEFQIRVMEAARKWRTPNTPIPHIYPTDQDWKECMFRGKDQCYQLAQQAIMSNKLTSLDEQGELIS